MSLQLNGTAGVTYNDGSNQPAAASPYGLKNLIINGNMAIDQRNAGSAKTIGDGSNNINYIAYTLDRWQAQSYTSGSGTGGFEFTVQQVSDAPDNFTNSAKFTVTSAKSSLAAQDVARVQQSIEGYNFAHLKWGTSDAKDITISFWVKSSLTGTFSGSIHNGSGTIHSYPFTYNISSANTWEKKTLTILGYTSGTWVTTNGMGLKLVFSLGCGSDYKNTAFSWTTGVILAATGETPLVSTNGATWQITGVQLEIGDTATPFENRMYSQELALCQRYFQSFGGSKVAETVGQGTSFSTTNTYVLIHLLQTMRSVPSLGYSAVGDWRLHYPGVTGQEATVMAISTNDSNNTKVIVNTTTATNASMGGGKCIQLTADSTISARLTFSAEL